MGALTKARSLLARKVRFDVAGTLTVTRAPSIRVKATETKLAVLAVTVDVTRFATVVAEWTVIGRTPHAGLCGVLPRSRRTISWCTRKP